MVFHVCLFFVRVSFSLSALASFFSSFIFSPGHIYLKSRETYDPQWGKSLAT